jgi:Ca2+-binding RTX toxin-like protein
MNRCMCATPGLVFGGAGNDRIDGGAGDDTPNAAPGNNFIEGGPGTDGCFVDPARDTALPCNP